MADIVDMIRKDIDEDAMLKVHGLAIDLTEKGLFRRRATIRVSGSVKRASDRDKVLAIVRHHAGDAYEVVSELETGELAEA